MSVVLAWSPLRGHRLLNVAGVLASYLNGLHRMKEGDVSLAFVFVLHNRT